MAKKESKKVEKMEKMASIMKPSGMTKMYGSSKSKKKSC